MRGEVVCTHVSRVMYPGAETVTCAGRLVALCVKELTTAPVTVSVIVPAIVIVCCVGGEVGTGGDGCGVGAGDGEDSLQPHTSSVQRIRESRMLFLKRQTGPE